MNVAHCRSCNAKIVWAQTEKSKPIPLDASPYPDGNILLSVRTNEKGEEQYVAFYQSAEQITIGKKQAQATNQPFRLFKSHFATCKDANKWRKK